MKKIYEAPQAKKVEFRYEEVVVASSIKCEGDYDLHVHYTFDVDTDDTCEKVTSDPGNESQTENG